jgi:predicted O-methyltransferase YrrM
MDIEIYLKEYHKDVEGWCSPLKVRKLYEYITIFKPSLCVEIGVFGGSSLLPQSLGLKSNQKGLIVGIDPWCNNAAIEGMENIVNKDWWSKVDMNYIYNKLTSSIKQLNLEQYIDLIKDKAENLCANFENESIDVLHIDGNHCEKSAFNDAFSYLPKVKENGIIIFDDITWSEKPGKVSTKKAHDFLLKNCQRIEQHEDWVVLKKLPCEKVS